MTSDKVQAKREDMVKKAMSERDEAKKSADLDGSLKTLLPISPSFQIPNDEEAQQ